MDYATCIICVIVVILLLLGLIGFLTNIPWYQYLQWRKFRKKIKIGDIYTYFENSFYNPFRTVVEHKIIIKDIKINKYNNLCALVEEYKNGEKFEDLQFKQVKDIFIDGYELLKD